jgi:PAS domain S-box-containing protein
MKEASIKTVTTNQKNLERILENLKDGIIAHDLNRRIFYFNNQAEKITGFNRKEVLGKDCHEIFGKPLCGENCEFLKSKPALKHDKEYTINVTSKNGQTRRVDMSATVIKDEKEKDFGILAFLRDVTDILHLQIKAGELTNFSNIVGKDSKMIQIFQQITNVAGFDYPVHIYGETGTGKELIATAIHNESRRSGAPFVPINCGSLPEGLIESELFGHVKGAFSGAIRDKKGRFSLAEGGSILLDEVAELSKYMQVKLLRFLQDNKFEKVGGEKTISVDVRIISATNKDLKKEVQQNNFREDLYYRLNVIPMLIPPIRERRNDIPLLIDHFLDETRRRYDGKPFKISKEAVSIMMDYKWPGNVRELQNAIQFAIVKSDGKIILPEDLPIELRELANIRSIRGPSKKLDIDRVRIALKETGGNKAKAARLLGVGRATLYRFLGNPFTFKKPQMITL